MGVFFVYMLKSSVCLAMFYLFYRMLLSKETFHRFNRIALLGVLSLSCLVPMMEVTTAEASELGQPFLELEEMMLMVGTEPEGVLAETSSPFPWRALMLLVYVGGILFFVLRHLWSLGRMVRLLRASRRETLKGGITLFVHREKAAPFSWMNMIAVSEEDLEENRNAILTHERAHIKNCHSWDLLLAEMCIFFQWFNPAAWLLKQELQTIHEYEADEWVINNGIDAKTYQLLIIKKAVGARLYSIANSFNHSSLKKRITMMIKKKSNPWARLKYLYVLPLAAVAVAAFARPEVSNEFNEISSVKVNDLASIVKAEEAKSVENSLEQMVMSTDSVSPVKEKVIFQVVEEMPEFPGGVQEMMNFFSKNMRYPAESHKNGIQGRVIVSFVVTDEGEIKDPVVVKGVDPLLDAEALRVIKMMPKWKPGKQRGKAVYVYFTVPVEFKLQ